MTINAGGNGMKDKYMFLLARICGVFVALLSFNIATQVDDYLLKTMLVATTFLGLNLFGWAWGKD